MARNVATVPVFGGKVDANGSQRAGGTGSKENGTMGDAHNHHLHDHDHHHHALSRASPVD